MPVKFSPDGLLDVATEPSDLPFQIVNRMITSGAMARCTNLSLDEHGKAKTRNGSTKLNAAALTGIASELIEQDGDRYVFTPGYIYKNEAAIASGLSAGNWSAFVYNAYNSLNQCIFATNGEDRKRIQGGEVYEWGLEAPNNAPQIAPALAADGTILLDGSLTPLGGVLTGVYKALYTYCRKEGEAVVCESNPSPESNSATLASDSLAITCSTPIDTQATHIRMYRTTAGGSQYYWDKDLPITTTAATMSTVLQNEDTALGAEAVWNNSRPPAGSFAYGPTFNGYCFLSLGNKFYFCKAHQPESWPLNYYIEVGPPQHPIRSITVWGGSVWVFTDIEIIQIQGTGAASYFPVPMKAQVGTRGRRAMCAIKGVGMFHWGGDGIYCYSGSEDEKFTEKNFGPIFKGSARGSMPAIDQDQLENCIILVFNGKIWFGYPAKGSTYPDNFLVYNISAKNTVHYQYTPEFSIIKEDVTNRRLLAVDTDGYVWELDSADYTDDAGTAIPWQIESKAFSSQFYKYFPRYAKYDIALDSPSATATGNILLEEEIKQIHQIIVSRNSRYRHITGCNGNRLGMRITGTGPVTIYGVEVE